MLYVMKDELRKVVELLKKQVKTNLEIIHTNEEFVRTILNEPVSDSRSGLLETKFKLNKSLLHENNESIKLQFEIIKFLEKHGEGLDNKGNIDEKLKQINELKEINVNKNEAGLEYSKDDYFYMTINGDLLFDTMHPYFNNNEFRKKLLKYYIDCEDYEMCDYIINA